MVNDIQNDPEYQDYKEQLNWYASRYEYKSNGNIIVDSSDIEHKVLFNFGEFSPVVEFLLSTNGTTFIWVLVAWLMFAPSAKRRKKAQAKMIKKDMGVNEHKERCISDGAVVNQSHLKKHTDATKENINDFGEYDKKNGVRILGDSDMWK